jgi:hypothetical protein
MNGGKPVNVSSSITPIIGERLTDIYVNRLQTRITKAVKNCCPIQKGL